MVGYYFRIDGTTEQYEIEECSLDDIEEVLFDNDIQDFLEALCSKSPTFEKVVGAGFDVDDMWKVKDYVDREYIAKYAGKSVRVFDHAGKEVKSFPLPELYNNLLEGLLDGENLDIEICTLWSAQLQNFIDRGQWHVAMRAMDGVLIENVEDWPIPVRDSKGVMVWRKDGIDYVPMMWYGLSDGEILPEWVVGANGMDALVTIENGMGDYGGQYRIQGLEINYLSLYDDGAGSWYFGSCGYEGADFSKVLDTCPINLVELYGGKNGLEVVEEYCYGLRNKADG